MAQRIIDLDVIVPERIGVKIDDEVYDLPGDIPVPDYLAIARLTDALGDEAENAGETFEELYERVIDLFRVHNPDLVDLPLGPTRLGALVVQLYTQAAEEDAPPARPTKAKSGTRSTSRTKSKRSRSSK